MKATELLRANGWRESVTEMYWEHDRYRGVRYMFESAIADELERHAVRLTEATALLDWWVREWDVHWMPQRLLDATLAWKDRAPAQSAASVPDCNCAALGAVVLCDACYRSRQPAVPEPSDDAPHHTTDIWDAAPEPSFITRDQAAADRVTLGPYKIQPAAPTPFVPERHGSCYIEQVNPSHWWIAAPAPSAGRVSHEEARCILSRFNASHFNNPEEHARYSIPARQCDDDLTLARYIEQNRSAEAQLAAVREAANNQALTPHQRWERIMRVLTPAPSPGAGEKP